MRLSWLEGDGLRKGTRCVLTPDGQERVFSQGMKHKKCPGRGGKGVVLSLLLPVSAAVASLLLYSFTAAAVATPVLHAAD